MKKAIVLLMMIANLGSGIAFAWDTHFEPTVVHSHNAITVGEADQAAHNLQDSQQPHHNDHCAHSAAHLVGVFACYRVAVPATVNYQIQNGFPESAFPSLYITPLLRPPIV